MQALELPQREQESLNAAFVRAEMAVLEAGKLRQAADQAERKAEAMAAETRGALRMCLETKGLNPEAYLANWNGEHVQIIEKGRADDEEKAVTSTVPELVKVAKNGSGS